MNNQQPFFSIIIPTYNRPEKLTNCLQSLTKLNYKKDNFEVIIVDDGSTTSYESTVTPFQKQLNIKFIRQDNSGPGNARNRGVTEAKGQYLAFTDDDCQPAPNWLSAFADAFRQYPYCLLGGHTINQLNDNIYSSASQQLIDYLYSYYNKDPHQATFFTGNNFAISKHLFEKIGGFDITFYLGAGEDREFCDRTLNQGYQMIYIKQAIIYHAHQLTFSKYMKQHFNYGRGAFMFHQIRAKKNLVKIQVEPISFYFSLLTYPLKYYSGQFKLFLVFLLLASQIANTFGFFFEKQLS